MKAKEYIGDSVYIEDNGYGVTLTTENGYGASNTIVMEPAVLREFLRYLEQPEPPVNNRPTTSDKSDLPP